MAAEEDATSCPVCQDIYNDPRNLLCGHSFCLKCIEGVAGSRQTFPCPICRFSVDLRDRNVAQLPKNFVLCNVIEAKGKTQPSMCLEHKKLLDIFCEGCDVVICSKCLSTLHKGHVIEDIDKIFIERNEKLSSFLATTKLWASMIQEKSDVIGQSRNSMEKNADSIRKTVDNIFKKWYDALHTQQNKILSYFHQERDKKRHVYDDAESILKSSMTNVTGLESEINNIRSKDTAFVVQLYGSVKARQDDTGRKVLLDIKTCFTSPDDLKVEVYAPWIEEAIDNIELADIMQTKARPRQQKISEIQRENIILKRDNKRFEDETKYLDALLSDLHKYVTTRTEAKDTSFELPSEIKPDSAVASNYKAVQDIWKKFMEMKGTNERMKEKNKQLEMSVQDMALSLSQEKEIVSDLQKRVQSLESDLENTNAVKIQLHSDCETLLNTHDRMKEKNKQLVESVQDMARSLSQEKETVSDQQKSLEMTDKLVATYQQREAQMKAAYDGEVLKTGIQKKQIFDLQVQRDELLNRLSKLAGDRLTHENTNITDLSDTNRPTKLSETYSELYDNEWTDAFEELTDQGLTDKAAVGKLLDMLLVTFHKCREITWERYRSLKSIVSTIDMVQVLPCVREFPESEQKGVVQTSEPMECQNQREQQRKRETELTEVQWNRENLTMSNGNSSNDRKEVVENIKNPDDCTINASKESEILYDRSKEVELTPQSKEEHLTCTTTVTLDQEKEIKSIWRTTTTALKDEAVKHLHIVLLTKFGISIEDRPKTSKYLASCIDLCWKMGIQEKPMHLDAFAEKGDGCEKIFDLEKFRAYTKSGKRVAFVVWPALFLHEGGAMLAKGIAQGCKETDK